VVPASLAVRVRLADLVGQPGLRVRAARAVLVGLREVVDLAGQAARVASVDREGQADRAAPVDQERPEVERAPAGLAGPVARVVPVELARRGAPADRAGWVGAEGPEQVPVVGPVASGIRSASCASGTTG